MKISRLPLATLDLTHWGRVTLICVSRLDNPCFRLYLVAYSGPSHYLNQWWHIVNYALRNTFWCNIIWNSKVFIQEDAFGNIVCEKVGILSRPQCVKGKPHLVCGTNACLQGADWSQVLPALHSRGPDIMTIKWLGFQCREVLDIFA